MGAWKTKEPWIKALPLLGGLWVLAALVDRLWFVLDQNVPAWDQADYLNGALNYWRALKTAQFLSHDWWVEFWQLSTKIPPLGYLLTVPYLNLFGPGIDQSTLVNLFYTAILLGSVYALGCYLFTVTVGLWAAGFCLLMPALYVARLDYLLDYPQAALVALCFTCLTFWRGESQRSLTWQKLQPDALLGVGSSAIAPAVTHPVIAGFVRPAWSASWQTVEQFLSVFRAWVLALVTGLTLGLALMVKQPSLLFLLVPFVWAGGETIGQRAWNRLGQWGLAILLASLVIYPWYRTNWLLMLSASKRATIDSAALEGDPSLASLDAWMFYLRLLPGMVSWPLLLVPLLGLLFFWRRSRVSSLGKDKADFDPKPKDYQQHLFASSQRSLLWLLLFLVGSYLLCSLNVNKDARYFMSGLPVLAVILAYGFSLLPRQWTWLRWGAIGLCLVLMVGNLFPIAPVAVRQRLQSPYQHYPYMGPAWPHAQVVAAIVQAEPYLASTVGVIPSTAQINQHNVNYFGRLNQFQVTGRQVGTRQKFVPKDVRSLSWFLTKTDNQGSIRQKEAQSALMQAVEEGVDFRLHQAWPLPDGSALKLFRRQAPLIEVKPVAERSPIPDGAPIRLEKVTVPDAAPPGQAIPVTYQWYGPWNALQSGLVVLTWQKQGQSPEAKQARWFHDHAIAMGQLTSQTSEARLNRPFQVIERTAMLPPNKLPSGTYTLQATYLDRKTGQATPLAVPPVSLKIEPNATPSPAPELDLVTQLRNLAAYLPQGPQALDRVFDEIGRINQYGNLDYIDQTRQAMEYRLKQEPDHRIFNYTLALANVLDQKVEPAIAALQRVVQVDPKNPFSHAYLAFVNLYDFRASTAQAALKDALALDAKAPELYGLRGIASLMQGNLMGAWQDIQTYEAAQKQQKQKS